MAKKHQHHTIHESHKAHRKKSFPWKALVAFVILVAIVYGIIIVLSKVGRDDVAAYVNGEAITMDYIDEQYAKIPPQYQELVTKGVLLNQTINEKILLQEAASKGIAVSQSEVQASIDEAMQAAGLTEEQMEEKLAEQNLTVEFLTDLYTRQMTISKLLEEQVFKDIKVTKKEVETEYNNQIHAAHILVETEDEADDIISQLDRARDPETLFFQLAEEKSIDPSGASNKGDLGEFGKGMMVPDFEKAAFALEEGKYTETPVKTQFGYHVILRLPREQTLEEAGDSIYEYLLNMKKSEAVPPYVEGLRNKAKVEIVYKD